MTTTDAYTTATKIAEVPLTFDYDEMLDFFINVGDPTAEQVETAASRLGRNWYPGLICGLHSENLLLPEVAAVVVPSAWSAAEFPMRQLDDYQWLELFGLAGYTDNGKPTERPTQPLTLWRGSSARSRLGWAWTDDQELAQWFAARGNRNGLVWGANVEPKRLLARITEHRPGESEYVVDTRGMSVEQWIARKTEQAATA